MREVFDQKKKKKKNTYTQNMKPKKINITERAQNMCRAYMASISLDTISLFFLTFSAYDAIPNIFSLK